MSIEGPRKAGSSVLIAPLSQQPLAPAVADGVEAQEQPASRAWVSQPQVRPEVTARPAVSASPVDPLSAKGAPAAKMIGGELVKTGVATYPQLAPFAGTTNAFELQKAINKGQIPGVGKDVVLEGPSVFSPDAKLRAPNAFQRLVDKVGVWSTFQLSNSPADRLNPFSHTHDNPVVTSAEVLKLTKELGPDGKPKLMPGDMILSGSGKITGHMSIYVGDDAEGKPMIVHAMATAATGQSYLGVVGEAVKAATTTTGKVGVIQEGMAEFFDRWPRESLTVIRDPRMTPEMREKGLARAKELVGKGYDYDLSLSNDTFYCSEVGVEMMKAAYQDSGKPLPWIGTRVISQATINSYVAEPENFAASPDFVMTGGNALGTESYKEIAQTRVLGAQAPGARVGTADEAKALIPPPPPKPDPTMYGGG